MAEAETNTDAEKVAETIRERTQEGWGWPMNAKKPHYFDEGESISLCGRWMYFGPREAPTPGKAGEDDCVGCTRKLEKRAAAGG